MSNYVLRAWLQNNSGTRRPLNDWTMVCVEIDEILHEVERATGRFARTAVEAAVERREKISPELLRILAETTQRAAELETEVDYMAHLYAMYLPAQFRETRPYPLVVRFASLRASGRALGTSWLRDAAVS